LPEREIPEGFVAIGRVLGAWGVQGDFKVEPLAPASAFARGRTIQISGKTYVIERSRARQRFVYVKLAGIDFREQVATIRGGYMMVPETELAPLPEGEYYRYQLIGLAVRVTDGRDIGRIEDVFSTGANDVYVVRGPLGEVLVPAVEDVVQSVDVAGGIVTIVPVPGLLPG